jgi:hypothetical protein
MGDDPVPLTGDAQPKRVGWADGRKLVSGSAGLLWQHPHLHRIYVDREEPVPLSAVSCGGYTGLRAGGGVGVEPVQHPEIRYGDVRRTRTGDRPACACQWVVDDEV